MHPKRIVLLLAMCAMTSLAFAGPEARVTQLPDDSAVGYVTIMAHDDWQIRQGEKELIEYWLAQPGLITAHGESRYLFYRESDAMYQRRLRQENSKLPAIMVQYADGRIAFKDHGGDAGDGCDCEGAGRKPRPVIFPWNKRSVVVTPPGPKPDVNTNVVVAPQPQPIPDKVPIKPKEPEASPGLLWAIIAGVVVLVAALTFAVQFHKRVAKVK